MAYRYGGLPPDSIDPVDVMDYDVFVEWDPVQGNSISRVEQTV